LFAWDRWAILLGSPTNMAFGGKDFDELYVANLARTTISRARVSRKGQPLANQKFKPSVESRQQIQFSRVLIATILFSAFIYWLNQRAVSENFYHEAGFGIALGIGFRTITLNLSKLCCE
jgi:hypothetical protein